MRKSDALRVFLRPTSASARVNRDQGLSIRTLGMFVFHVGVQGGVREVSLVTVGALVVSALDIIL